LRNGKIVFLADAEPASSPGYSPPGQFYAEAPPALHQIFTARVAAIVGPYTDRSGNWVSGFAPIFDQKTGAMVAVLGLDIGTQNWKATIASYRSIGIAVSGLLVIMELIFGLLLIR
jgi:hypothetical protein